MTSTKVQTAARRDEPITAGETLLEVRDLAVEFRTPDGTFRAVDGLS